MKPSEILRAARELLSEPHRWTTRFLARNGAGQRVEPTSPAAVCWCLNGALSKVAAQAEWEQIQEAWKALTMAATGDQVSVGLWNDDPHRTHAEILDALDRASARAEESEKGE
jgi:hypothetical protein